jgi:hypothetical protein
MAIEEQQYSSCSILDYKVPTCRKYIGAFPRLMYQVYKGLSFRKKSFRKEAYFLYIDIYLEISFSLSLQSYIYDGN